MAFSYVVQQGDTLYRIARNFGVNVIALQNANPQIQNMDYIVPGQVILIPERPPNIYIVQPGDTFFLIARRFNISLQSLLAANPSVDPARLQIGQAIILPPFGTMDIVQTDAPYGYDEMIRDLDELVARYPFLVRGSIGVSVMGKQLPVIIIGRGPKKIHYNGSFHANEWITTLLLMKYIEDFAKAYSAGASLRGRDVERLFNEVSLWIVPMVNPDGVELVLEGITPNHPYYEQLLEWNNGSFQFEGWKANIRGVDLNDQFPAHWEEERERRSPPGPGPRDYVGTAPLTEPEAIEMANMTRNEDFLLVMAYHSQGEVIFWNYRDYEPPQSETIANRLAAVSGYEAVRLTGSDAGYKDWFIQEFRRPGFTIEVGRGVNPLPISEFPRIYDDVIQIMLEGMTIASESDW